MKTVIRPESEMKDSGIEWIGDIPKDWNSAPIKVNFDIYAGATPSSNNPIYWDGDIAWITPADYKTEDKYVSCGKRHISQDGYDNCSAILVPANSIIFSKRAPIGTVAISKNELCTNQGCLSCVSKDDSNIEFYYYAMSIATEEFELKGSGTTFKEISLANFKNFRFAVPPLSEQQAIANYLDETCSKIDEIIAEAKASIDEYKELKQAVILEAVTKGLDKNVEMKDSGYDFIGDIPSKWEMCKVRHLGTAQNGISIGGDAFGSGHSFVSYGDVYKNYSLPKTVDKLVRSSEEDRKRYSVEKGDWFFTRTSETIEEVGFSCVCEETIPDAVFAGFLIRVRPFNNRIYTGFAKYYFRSNHLRTFFVKEMNLVTRASLAQGLLKDAPVVVPPYDEQIEIANYLENKCKIIDGVIKDKESTINDLEAYKKSLIYEVVTGKRRVV